MKKINYSYLNRLVTDYIRGIYLLRSCCLDSGASQDTVSHLTVCLRELELFCEDCGIVPPTNCDFVEMLKN